MKTHATQKPVAKQKPDPVALETLGKRAEIIAGHAEPGELRLLARAAIARGGWGDLGAAAVAIVRRLNELYLDAVVRAAKWLGAAWRRS